MGIPVPNGRNAEFPPPPFDRDEAARQVRRTRGIARVVRGLFSLVAGLSLAVVAPIYQLGRLERVAGTLGPFVLPAAVLALVTFLWWLTDASRAVATLGRRPIASARMGPILFAFFVPVVNLVRPYDMVSSLDSAADPNDIVPAPPAEARVTERGYRAPVASAEVPRRRRAWTRAWWASVVLSVFVVPTLGIIAAFNDFMNGFGEALGEGCRTNDAQVALGVEVVVFITSALLTMVIIGQIQGRIDERFKRLRDAAT